MLGSETPIARAPESGAARAFMDIAREIARQLAVRSHEATEAGGAGETGELRLAWKS